MSKTEEEKQVFECLHRCRYCDSFTGDDTTGCAGRSGETPCGAWNLDWLTAPRWAKDYRYLFDD